MRRSAEQTLILLTGAGLFYIHELGRAGGYKYFKSHVDASTPAWKGI